MLRCDKVERLFIGGVFFFLVLAVRLLPPHGPLKRPNSGGRASLCDFASINVTKRRRSVHEVTVSGPDQFQRGPPLCL